MTDSSMQNTDQRIDQLLHAFNNVETPSRLEERVAARVARHSAMTGRRTPRLFFFVAYPVAALVVLILAIAALHSHHTPVTIARLTQPSTAKPQRLTRSSAHEAIDPTAHLAYSKHKTLEAARTASAESADPDAIALAETRAPSHPAPPLPLSQQERLMLTILRSGEQEEIAALIPAERDALFARDQAAFNEYFSSTNQPSNTGDQK